MSEWLSEEQLMQLMKTLDETHGEETSYTAALEVRDGEIAVLPTGYDGIYPEITVSDPIKLYVNGEQVYGSTAVSPGDRIEWRIEEPPLYRIDVSADKMKAWFVLYAKERRRLKLKDQDRTHRLNLVVEEDMNAPPQTATFADVMESARQKGIVDIDGEAIYRELEHPSYAPVLIARGKEPVHGTDAKLELFFKETIESRFEEVNGVVDYRNHLKIPSVKKGELIARKHPMVPGQAGYNVFGQPIDPPHPKDIIMVGKQHVHITQNQEAYATRDGRPRIIGNRVKFIDIATAHVVPGDVDLRTGNIVFSGDIIIYGNVTDSMIVEALGDVYVMGHVYRATVTATGSIYIKGNTIGSKLYSGYFGVLFNRLYQFSNKLNDQFKLLRQTARQILSMASSKGQRVAENQVINLLMQTKFQDIPAIINDILICISNIQNIRREQMNDLKESLQHFVQTSAYQPKTDQDVAKLQSLLVETIDFIKRCEEMPVVTDIQQCHLTEILSNGDILIRKQGVLQSKLYAKNNIVFYDKHSVCRGSELEAGGSISAMIVGGVSGGGTVLKAGRKVVVDQIYQGRVTVNKCTTEVLEPMSRVQFVVRGNRLVAESPGREEADEESGRGTG
jgi:hypothetical protein